MVELFASNHIEIIIVPLLTLCSKGINQSHTSWEADDSESKFQQPLASHSGSWTGPLSPTIGHHSSSLIVVVKLYDLNGHHSSSLNHVIHFIPKKEWEVYPFAGPKKLLGLPLTHNSRHVASTFKRLTQTTTHCGLSKFIYTDGLQMKRLTKSVHGPYSDCIK